MKQARSLIIAEKLEQHYCYLIHNIQTYMIEIWCLWSDIFISCFAFFAYFYHCPSSQQLKALRPVCHIIKNESRITTEFFWEFLLYQQLHHQTLSFASQWFPLTIGNGFLCVLIILIIYHGWIVYVSCFILCQSFWYVLTLMLYAMSYMISPKLM